MPGARHMVGLSREGLPITPSKLAATVGAGRGGGEGPREQWGLSLLSGLCRGLKPRHPQCRVGLLGGHISCFRTTLDESCGCGGPSGPACPSSGQGHSPDLGAASQDSLSPSARRANALEEQLKEQELRACEMVLEETRKQKELLCKMEREKSIEIENLQARWRGRGRWG